jgi:hypothetical protein
VTGVGTLPNFLIVGALRSGTTSMARYLGSHPDVFVAPQKEVRYFDRNFERGIDWYARQFSGVAGESAVGEATPTYMYEELARERMREKLPEARLIAVLRNPVDRAYSHYWLNRATGIETLGFAAALDLEARRLDRGEARYAYADRGRYLRYLRRVGDLYHRGSLLSILFEDLRDRPEGTYRSVCRFLDVDARFVPPNLGRPINGFVTFRSPQLRRMTRSLPRPMRNAVGRLNARSTSYPPMDPSLRKELLRRFAEDNEALADWLGKDLAMWRT